jgi:SAM-dependent methyltransferase
LGAFPKELLPRCSSYIGIKYDADAGLAARQKTEGKANIIQGDARSLSFADSQFSFIVCLEVLEHLGDYQAGVRNIHRCLRPDGIAIISVPYRNIGGRSKTNEYHIYESGKRDWSRC